MDVYGAVNEQPLCWQASQVRFHFIKAAVSMYCLYHQRLTGGSPLGIFFDYRCWVSILHCAPIEDTARIFHWKTF